MVAPFLTRLESYRDPQMLWPLVAGLSVVAHGVLLLNLPAWTKPSPTPPQAIPIQLLTLSPSPVPDEAPGDSQTLETAVDAQVNQSAPMDQAFPRPSPAPPADLPPGVPAPAAPPALAPSPLPSAPATPPTVTPPVSTAPPATVTPPTPAAPPTVTPPASTTPPATVTPPAPAAPPTVTPPVPAAPPTAITPTPAAPPPSLGLATGQIVPLGIRPTPYGSDWPDTPPQLLSTAAIAIPPGAWGCGSADVGSVASPGTLVSLALRVQVEADGRISATYLDTSSGYPALDNLVSCMGQRQLRLAPALVDGHPHVTDAYQVDLQVRF